MHAIDLDAVWRSLPPTSGAGAGRNDQPISQASAPARTGAAPTNIDSTSSLAALHMPDLYFERQTSASDASRRFVQRLDGFVKSFDPNAALWLSMGFISGMMAWHSIGFWGFVTEAVLKTSEHDQIIAASARPPVQVAVQSATIAASIPVTTGSLPARPSRVMAEGEPCVALVVNRQGGTTRAQPCAGVSAQMRDAGHGPRGDRLGDGQSRLQSPVS